MHFTSLSSVLLSGLLHGQVSSLPAKKQLKNKKEKRNSPFRLLGNIINPFMEKVKIEFGLGSRDIVLDVDWREANNKDED